MRLDMYLEQLQNSSPLNIFLTNFEHVTEYSSKDDLTLGLLRFNKINHKYAFLFKFEEERMLDFHTIGMRFPINIRFYDKEGKLISSYYNVKSGEENISSKKPAMYAVEYSPKIGD